MPGFTEAMSRLIAASYLAPKARWMHPEAGLAARLPQEGADVRRGDFGEIIASIVYAHRMGRTVPFQRLEAKPVGGATLQGPDLLALTLDHGEDPAPVVVEVKYRAEISPAKDLKALAKSLANTDEDYLVSAWAVGVHLMESHPEESTPTTSTDGASSTSTPPPPPGRSRNSSPSGSRRGCGKTCRQRDRRRPRRMGQHARTQPQVIVNASGCGGPALTGPSSISPIGSALAI